VPGLHPKSMAMPGSNQTKIWGLDWGSTDGGHIFKHFQAFITGTDSFRLGAQGGEPKPPLNMPVHLTQLKETR